MAGEDQQEEKIKPVRYQPFRFDDAAMGYGHIPEERWNKAFGRHKRGAGRSRYGRCDVCGENHWSDQRCKGLA